MRFQGISTVGLVCALFLALSIALELSFRVGSWRRKRNPDEAAAAGTDVALSSILAILGLVLAFTYSAAVQRFDARKASAVDEANALATAFLRADLAPEPLRGQLRSAVLSYAETRIFRYEDVATPARLRARLKESEAARDNIWPLAVRIMQQEEVPAAARGAVVQSVNNLLDMDTRRRAAAFDRLPRPVVAFLVFLAVAALGLSGYNAGLAGGLHRWRMAALAIVLAMLIGVIVDYDRALRGLIVVPQNAIQSAVSDMQRAPD